jgi:hypothetical protein
MTARKGKHRRIARGPFRRVRRFVIVQPVSREEDATWLPAYPQSQCQDPAAPLMETIQGTRIEPLVRMSRGEDPRNQDRHLMIARTISRIFARLSRPRSTGNAAARLDRWPALCASRRASPKYRASTAHPKPTSQSGAFNRPTPTPQRPPSHCRATLKSHSAAPPRLNSRGFLPWRLSDDGPRCKWKCRNGAVIRNPSQKRTVLDLLSW